MCWLDVKGNLWETKLWSFVTIHNLPINFCHAKFRSFSVKIFCLVLHWMSLLVLFIWLDIFWLHPYTIWRWLSVQNTNHSLASAILFLSLTVEKQPSVEEQLFMPRRIVNICHPRWSEFVCTALQQLPYPCLWKWRHSELYLKSGWW